MTNWTIVFYTTPSGNCPVQDYINALSASDAERVYAAISRLAVHGLDLGMPHIRPLQGSELWELRIRADGDQHRVFYIGLAGQEFLLLHAFQKKSRETPQREIRTAERRLDEYWK